ncbi:MAG: NYN domain-containing protein [Patescibacteria group bacterium]
MSKAKKIPTNYAFIDSQNLNLGVKSQRWKLDWRKFRQYLRNKYHVQQAYLFIGHVSGNEALYTFLQKCGYLLIFKPTLEYKTNGKIKIKGNVDAELVLHTMIEWGNYNQAVIVSGDGDFHCLIEYLEKKDKLLKILAPNKKYSGLLRKFNKKNYIVRIDLLKKSLILSKNKKTGIRGRSKP